jgi:hypothetical protein
MLIRHANEYYFNDKSHQHMELITNFETLVDKFNAILVEKTRFVEKSVPFNQKVIDQMIFGGGPENEVGLIQFIDEVILKT